MSVLARAKPRSGKSFTGMLWCVVYKVLPSHTVCLYMWPHNLMCARARIHNSMVKFLNLTMKRA